MSGVILYLIMAVIGFVLGKKVKGQSINLNWTNRIQIIAIIILIIAMGLSMGANDRVIDNLNSIGIYALVITVSTMFFSVIAVSITRRLMGFNRYGNKEDIKEVDKAEEKNQQSHMTGIILTAVIIGMTAGYFFVDKIFSDIAVFESLIGYTITIGLCVLLFFVGIDLGISDTVGDTVRQGGVKMFFFPLAVVIGTLIGSLVAVAVLPLTIREALAIGSGFGWYSFAPGIIIERGFVIVGAISFMHNIFREMFSVLLIPFVAKRFGYLEVLGLAASADMDVCLPVIEKSTYSDIVIYAFITGLSVSLLVPVLVPIFIG